MVNIDNIFPTASDATVTGSIRALIQSDTLDDHDRDILNENTLRVTRSYLNKRNFSVCEITLHLNLFEGLSNDVSIKGLLIKICSDIVDKISSETFTNQDALLYFKKCLREYFSDRPNVYGLCSLTHYHNGIADTVSCPYNHDDDLNLLFDYLLYKRGDKPIIFDKIRINRAFSGYYGLSSEMIEKIEDKFNEELEKLKKTDYGHWHTIDLSEIKVTINDHAYTPILFINSTSSRCYLCQNSEADEAPSSIKQQTAQKTKFIVGNHYMLKFKSLYKKDTVKKTYELKKFVYSMKDEPLNIVIMKQLTGPVSNMLFTLSKKDCERIHLKFEPGLQVFPMSMDWINLTQKQKNEKIHQAAQISK